MFEFMKDYATFTKSLRDIKAAQFEELRGLIDENQKLKRDLADIQARHEREVLTLTHEITLERQRFELEKATKSADQTAQLAQQRETYMKKNFDDLQQVMGVRHEQMVEMMQLVVNRITDRRLTIDAPENDRAAAVRGETRTRE